MAIATLIEAGVVRRWRGAALAALSAALLCGTPAAAWRQEIDADGTLQRDDDEAVAIVVDGAGDAISTGTLNVDTPILDRTLIVVKQAAADGAELWRLTIADAVSTALARDGAGDVYVTGGIYYGLDEEFAVVKVDGATGAEVWRHRVLEVGTSGHTDTGLAVAVDASGDVIAAGTAFDAINGPGFTVVKLDGASGAELWRFDDAGGVGLEAIARALALTSTGDALVSGVIDGVINEVVLLKIDATTGAELWRNAVGDAPSQANNFTVAVDASDDAVLGSSVAPEEDVAVVKVDGATGTEIWRYQPAGDGASDEAAESLAIDVAGNVVVGGGIDGHSYVVKLAAASGSPLWTRQFAGRFTISTELHVPAIAVDAAGAVIGAGQIEGGPTNQDFLVFKLDGGTGAEVWQKRFDTTFAPVGSGLEHARALVLDAAGDVLVAGMTLFYDGTSLDDYYTTLKLDGDDGSVGPLNGRKLVVKDKDGDPSRRQIVAQIKDLATSAPLPGSANDPIIAGAKFALTNPLTMETASFTLPGGATFWKGLGMPAGSKGYRYLDADGVNGPCKLLIVKPARLAKVVCSGRLGTIPFTLDEVTQTTLTATIQLGAGTPQCARFGGIVAGDDGTLSPGPNGRFVANKARAPLGVCPAP